MSSSSALRSNASFPCCFFFGAGRFFAGRLPFLAFRAFLAFLAFLAFFTRFGFARFTGRRFGFLCAFGFFRGAFFLCSLVLATALNDAREKKRVTDSGEYSGRSNGLHPTARRLINQHYVAGKPFISSNADAT